MTSKFHIGDKVSFTTDGVKYTGTIKYRLNGQEYGVRYRDAEKRVSFIIVMEGKLLKAEDA